MKRLETQTMQTVNSPLFDKDSPLYSERLTERRPSTTNRFFKRDSLFKFNEESYKYSNIHKYIFMHCYIIILLKNTIFK
jgi:hypothetical protein